MEILRGVSTTIRFPARGEDAVSFSKAPTLTVTRDSTGAKVVDAKATTEVEGKEGDIDHYTYELKAEDLSEVDLLTAVWSDGTNSYTTEIEVVGGFVVSKAAIKDKLGEEVDDWKVEAKREIALREIEAACGVAFRPRYAKELIDGTGSARLLLNKRELQSVISVEVEESALSESDISGLTLDRLGILIRDTTWPAGKGNIEVAYVHGYQSFPPAEMPVRDYAAYLLAERPTDWNERATGLTTEVGTYQLVTPGVRGARFPLPSVNAFVNQYAEPLVR